MGLGYLLLATKSEQDNYLVGNPQFTFFKQMYKKHTNFAIDNMFLNFVGDTTNCYGRKLYMDIPENADLLHKMYIAIDIESTGDISGCNPIAYSMIEYVELFIGGQSMDKHPGEYLYLAHELFQNKQKELALADMVSTHRQGGKNTIYIPLRFWFNNDIGMSLPLIALQYAKVRVEIKFNNAATVQTYIKNNGFSVQQTVNIKRVQLLAEYIHLDNEERRLFSSNSHEYLITQLQYSFRNPIQLFITDSDTMYEKIQHRVDLRFNHPVKELLWTIQDSHGRLYDTSNNGLQGNLYNYEPVGVFQYNYWRNFKAGVDQLLGANIVLNGKDMTEELPANFYRSVQQYQYHNGFGVNYIRDLASNLDKTYPNYNQSNGSGIYSYSFAIKPEEHQPSGSLNFSKLEKAQLKFRIARDAANFTNGGSNNITYKTMNIYAINYNVVRIESNLAGLAFTN